VSSQEEAFRIFDDLTLLERAWLPGGRAKASVALVHGYAEHSGRYEHVGRHLADAGYAAYAFDLRGHGRSGGARANVGSFNEYLADLSLFLRRVRARHPEAPPFLFGHSMGGTIVTLYAIARQPELRGLIVCAAGLAARDPAARALAPLFRGLGRLAPNLPLAKLNSADVSRDPEVVRAYDEDHLVYRGRVRAGLIAASLRAVRYIERHMEDVKAPLLVLHGTEDALTPLEGSRELHRRAAAQDKTLKLYDGLYHEILNEPEQATVLADLTGWLDARVEAMAPREGAAHGR